MTDAAPAGEVEALVSLIRRCMSVAGDQSRPWSERAGAAARAEAGARALTRGVVGAWLASEGPSWGVVGRATGTTRQAARERYTAR